MWLVSYFVYECIIKNENLEIQIAQTVNKSHHSGVESIRAIVFPVTTYSWIFSTLLPWI